MNEYKITKDTGLMLTLIREGQEGKQFRYESHDNIKLEVNGSDLWITDIVSGEKCLTIDNPIQLISRGWIQPV